MLFLNTYFVTDQNNYVLPDWWSRLAGYGYLGYQWSEDSITIRDLSFNLHFRITFVTVIWNNLVQHLANHPTYSVSLLSRTKTVQFFCLVSMLRICVYVTWWAASWTTLVTKVISSRSMKCIIVRLKLQPASPTNRTSI